VTSPLGFVLWIETEVTSVIVALADSMMTSPPLPPSPPEGRPRDELPAEGKAAVAAVAGLTRMWLRR